MPKILITGGAGFIGSHIAVALLKRGDQVAIVDNFSSSSPAVPARIARLTGAEPLTLQLDVREQERLANFLSQLRPDAVIHCAGLKSVAESRADPLRYYSANLASATAVLRAMQAAGVARLVFSSSASVYGQPQRCPVAEAAPIAPANPYGASKAMIERIIADFAVAWPGFTAGVLRYFNPIGAHESGMIGENPRGEPTNLMPLLCRVAARQSSALEVFGTDWPTPDGSGIRDFLHIEDLAAAHLAALDRLLESGEGFIVNLGTGKGVSVREMVAAFTAATGISIPLIAAPRRVGDVAECYADPTLAARLLGWRAQCDITRMCADAWRWHSANPNGYEG